MANKVVYHFTVPYEVSVRLKSLSSYTGKSVSEIAGEILEGAVAAEMNDPETVAKLKNLL